MRTYPIKPLALHERVHVFDGSRPLNTLTLTGTFSMAEAHSWLVLCVSQIPERIQSQDESITFNFRSTFNGGTMLQATYGKGKAVYRSDNLSTIVILRDVISKIVTMRQLKVHISCETNNDSVPHTLQLIHPKMQYQTDLIKKLELAKGIKELEATFDDISYLSPELKETLRDYDRLHTDVTNKSIYFDRVLGIITDLYIDKYKIMGQNVKHRASELLTVLHEDYSLEKLIEFFNTKP
ncbi:bardet-Biedl syndrome 7 protein [Ditylenchus destructor]|nr:bardet-Biedl syndrome 7 protein [Ditylenchus destructor]